MTFAKSNSFLIIHMKGSSADIIKYKVHKINSISYYLYYYVKAKSLIKYNNRFIKYQDRSKIYKLLCDNYDEVHQLYNKYSYELYRYGIKKVATRYQTKMYLVKLTKCIINSKNIEKNIIDSFKDNYFFHIKKTNY